MKKSLFAVCLLMLSGCSEGNDLGKDESVVVPQVILSIDNGNDRLVVSSFTQGLDWSQLAISTVQDKQWSFLLNTLYIGNGQGITIEQNTKVAISQQSNPIYESDWIQLCTKTNPGLAYLTIWYIKTDEKIGKEYAIQINSRC